jgi:hypothetical protein
VSARLGNTPTICRKCYVHPEILDCYLDEALVLEIEAEAKAESDSGTLRPDEAAVLALLRQRLKRMERGGVGLLAPSDATLARARRGGRWSDVVRAVRRDDRSSVRPHGSCSLVTSSALTSTIFNLYVINSCYFCRNSCLDRTIMRF